MKKVIVVYGRHKKNEPESYQIVKEIHKACKYKNIDFIQALHMGRKYLAEINNSLKPIGIIDIHNAQTIVRIGFERRPRILYEIFSQKAEKIFLPLIESHPLNDNIVRLYHKDDMRSYMNREWVSWIKERSSRILEKPETFKTIKKLKLDSVFLLVELIEPSFEFHKNYLIDFFNDLEKRLEVSNVIS